MKHSSTRRRAISVLSVAPLVLSGWARAQDVMQPLRLLSPVGPGSAGDILLRKMAEQLGTGTKQTIIVENKPGADGLIALQALLTAPADGSTVLQLGPQQLVFNPLLRNDLPYAIDDIRPVIGFAQFWCVLVAGPNARFTSFDEFVAAARTSARSVSLGTSGLSFRVGAEYLARKIETEFLQIEYKTTPQMLTDIMGGTLDCAFIPSSGMSTFVDSGKLRMLAAASTSRLPKLPKVPTIRERGVDFDWPLWMALAVGAKTPDVVTARLESQFRAALTSKEMREAAADLDFEVTATPGRKIATLAAADTERLRDVVKDVVSQRNATR